MILILKCKYKIFLKKITYEEDEIGNCKKLTLLINKQWVERKKERSNYIKGNT